MSPQEAAQKAIRAYLDDCPSNWGHAACLRVLLQALSEEYAKRRSARQAYETLATIALDTFNADMARRKQEESHG